MIGRRSLGLVGIALLLAALAWIPYALYRQLRETAASAAICLDDGVGNWQSILADFSASHAGRLPDAAQRVQLVSLYRAQSWSNRVRCNKGAPYEWNAGVTRVATKDAVPLLWCGRPHGFTSKWRNVIFSDLKWRRVPETEFRSWRIVGTPLP